MTYRHPRLTMLVVAGSVLMLTVDGTVLFLAVPALTQDLGPTAAQVLWIGDIYPLALAGLLITMGNVADSWGPKQVLLTGLLVFGIASLVAATSTTPEMLIGARLMMGIAGSAIMPSTLAIIRELFLDPSDRSRGIAVWSAAGSAGLAIGPLVGGALLEHFWWGSVLLVNVPVVAVLLIVGMLFVPDSRRVRSHRIDGLSAALSITMVVAPVYAIQRSVGSGMDAVMIVVLTLGLWAGFVFVRRQRHLDSPMVDVHLFRQAAFTGAVVVNFTTVFALTGLLFFFSQYLQLVRGYSPLAAGFAEVPLTIATLLAVGAVGATARRFGVGRSVAIGLLLTATGFVLIAIAESSVSYAWLGLTLLPIGLGIGLSMTLTTDVVVSSATPRTAGSASALAEAAYQLGSTLGIAVLGTLLTIVYRGSLKLPPGMSPQAERQAQDSLASAVHASGTHSALTQNARHAFVTAMQTTSVTAAVITAVAAGVAWILLPARLRSHHDVDRR